MREIRQSHAFVVADAATDERLSQGGRNSAIDRDMAARVAVPIVKDDRLAGLFVVMQKAPRAWTAAEVVLIKEAAKRAAAAVERAQTEAALAASESRFRALVTSTSEMLYRMNADWSEMLSFSGGGLLADTDAPLAGWVERYLPRAERPRVAAAIAAAVTARDVFELEHAVKLADGTIGWVTSRATPMLNERGEIDEWFGAAYDITDRRRNELWLAEQSRLLELIGSEHSLDEALDALCEATERLSGHARVAVLLANEERSAIARVVAHDIPAGFRAGIVGAPIGVACADPGAAAISDDKPVTSTDMGRDARWSREWYDLCKAHGIRACHATPVHDDEGTPRAALLLCFERAREVEPWQRRLGDLGAHIAGVALRHERADRALRESEKKYRSLFDTISDGICIIEMIYDACGEPVDFRYVETNSAFVEHATRPMLGKRVKEVVPDYEQGWLDTFGEVARTGKPKRREGIVHGLGDQWFRTSAVRFGGDGSHRVVVLFSNITAQKQAERDLVRLASIVDTSDDAIISKTLDGVINTWNASAERMFGYTAGEAIGRPISSLIIPADRLQEEEDILQRIKRGEAIEHLETVRKRKDGSLLDVSETISPLLYPGAVDRRLQDCARHQPAQAPGPAPGTAHP